MRTCCNTWITGAAVGSSGGSRGGSGGSLEPPSPPPPPVFKYPMEMNNLISMRPNYFIGLGYFKKNDIKSAKRTPILYTYGPLSRNPGSTPG